MKRSFLKMAFVCLFTAVVLNSCKKDEDDNGSIPGNTITAAVENGNSYNALVDSVKLELEFEVEDEWAYQTLAVAEYKNGGFTLTLPESVNSLYLNSFGDDLSNGITVSNKNVKIGLAFLVAFKSGKESGQFYLKSGNWEGGLIYVNGDVTITGNGSETFSKTTYIYSYSVNMKKGWNILYQKYAENGNTVTMEITTTAPAGAKWHYDPDLYLYLYPDPYPYPDADDPAPIDESSVSGARSGASLLQGKQKFRF